MLGRHRGPGGILEQWIVHRRVVCPVLPAHAEAQRFGDFIGQIGQAPSHLGARVTQIVDSLVGPDRGVAAGDVEAHAHHRDRVVVGGHTPMGMT